MAQTKKIVTSEDLFHHLQLKNIKDLSNDIMYMIRNGKLSEIEYFLSVFNQIFRSEAINYNLEGLVQILMVNKHNQVLEDDNCLFLLEKIFDLTNSLDEKFTYAQMRPEYPKFKAFIDEYKKNKNVEIPHALSDLANVTITNTEETSDYTISLFKSKQEKNFFSAALTYFNNYTVYPNVAISCLIDFDLVKDKLDEEEKQFFYKGIVDCVVFEIVHDEDYLNFKPKYFFELDSVFHDNPIQMKRDKLKDSIFKNAGLVLTRIRPIDNNTSLTEDEFEQILVDRLRFDIDNKQ